MRHGLHCRKESGKWNRRPVSRKNWRHKAIAAGTENPAASFLIGFFLTVGKKSFSSDRLGHNHSERKEKIRTHVRLGTLGSDYNGLAPQVGLEPTTLRLTAECSAIELLRNITFKSENRVIISQRSGLVNPFFNFFSTILNFDWPASDGCFLFSQDMVYYMRKEVFPCEQQTHPL